VKSISELVGELKGDGVACAVAGLVLHELDQELMKGREEGLRVKNFKERCLTTVFGDVRIRRRGVYGRSVAGTGWCAGWCG
jgi:hypothetical protein